MKSFSIDRLLHSEIDPAFADRAAYVYAALVTAQPESVLDAGCGRGFYLRMLSQLPCIRKICGMDLEDSSLQVAKRNCLDPRVQIVKGDVTRMPYPDDTFDFIICSEVLEHLPGDEQALFELHRVLKGNGTIVITVPNEDFPFWWDPVNWLLMHIFHSHVDQHRWWLAGIWADHERLYRMDQLSAVVASFDFELIDVRGAVYGCLPFSHFLLYGVGKNIIDRLGLHGMDRFHTEGGLVLGLVAHVFRFPSEMRKPTRARRACVSILMTARKRVDIHQ
jgi:2-polyprenyl-6-hydroxyphenyl methylase / 3-demethylubiquinone-9 3-methyltransferase